MHGSKKYLLLLTIILALLSTLAWAADSTELPIILGEETEITMFVLTSFPVPATHTFNFGVIFNNGEWALHNMARTLPELLNEMEKDPITKGFITMCKKAPNPPTPYWIDVYGDSIMVKQILPDGTELSPVLIPSGTVFSAYTPEGIVCGQRIFGQDRHGNPCETGYMDFQPIYGDDDLFDHYKCGAYHGDTIYFSLQNFECAEMTIWQSQYCQLKLDTLTVRVPYRMFK